jgi:hypothetical protein
MGSLHCSRRSAYSDIARWVAHGCHDVTTDFLSLLAHLLEYIYIALRLKIAIEIVLPEPEPIIGYPVTQGFELLPHFWIPLLDPGFNVGLPFTAGSGIEPVTQTTKY